METETKSTRSNMSLREKRILGSYAGGSLIGGLLTKYSDLPYKELIGNYGFDVFLPFGCYFFNKLIGSPLAEWKGVNAPFIFLGCSTFEIAQKFELFPGTFDQMDFIRW